MPCSICAIVIIICAAWPASSSRLLKSFETGRSVSAVAEGVSTEFIPKDAQQQNGSNTRTCCICLNSTVDIDALSSAASTCTDGLDTLPCCPTSYANVTNLVGTSSSFIPCPDSNNTASTSNLNSTVLTDCVPLLEPALVNVDPRPRTSVEPPAVGTDLPVVTDAYEDVLQDIDAYFQDIDPEHGNRDRQAKGVPARISPDTDAPFDTPVAPVPDTEFTRLDGQRVGAVPTLQPPPLDYPQQGLEAADPGVTSSVTLGPGSDNFSEHVATSGQLESAAGLPSHSLQSILLSNDARFQHHRKIGVNDGGRLTTPPTNSAKTGEQENHSVRNAETVLSSSTGRITSCNEVRNKLWWKYSDSDSGSDNGRLVGSAVLVTPSLDPDTTGLPVKAVDNAVAVEAQLLLQHEDSSSSVLNNIVPTSSKSIDVSSAIRLPVPVPVPVQIPVPTLVAVSMQSSQADLGNTVVTSHGHSHLLSSANMIRGLKSLLPDHASHLTSLGENRLAGDDKGCDDGSYNDNDGGDCDEDDDDVPGYHAPVPEGSRTL